MRRADDGQPGTPGHAPRPGSAPLVRRIVMAGCAPEAVGGISQVIHDLLHGPLSQEWPLGLCRSWVPGSRWKRALGFSQAASALWADCLRGQVQAVHVHLAARGSFWRKWLLAGPLMGSSVRVLVHVHDGSLPEWHARQNPVVRRLLRRFLEQSDAVVVLSRRWADALKTLAPGARFHVVPNAVVGPSMRSACALNPSFAAMGPPQRSPGHRQILFLGRLTPEKGLSELLEAARLLALEHPHWCWTLAGEGDIDALRDRVFGMGLQQQIRVPGPLNLLAKQAALGQADVLVLPSWAEGQPLAVLEAMAWSVPVVATAVGDIPDLLVGGGGLVVPPKDSAALASAIRRILLNPALAQAMGVIGQGHVLRHHSPDAVACALSSVYEELGLQRLSGADHPRALETSLNRAGTHRSCI